MDLDSITRLYMETTWAKSSDARTSAWSEGQTYQCRGWFSFMETFDWMFCHRGQFYEEVNSTDFDPYSGRFNLENGKRRIR